MARKKGLKFNRAGFEALREDRKVQDDLVARAERIRDASGTEDMGYLVRDNLAREGRSGASVIAVKHAANSNRINQTLIKNLHRGR